jgi:hypothetical protein
MKEARADADQHEGHLEIVEKDQARSPQFDLARVSQLVQVLTVAISACWILFQYFDFQRHANRLALEQQRLQNQQQKEARKYAELELARARQDVSLKDVDLRYAQLRSELEIERDKQEITLRSVDLQFAEALARVSLQQKEQETEAKELELQYAKDRKLDWEYGLEVERTREAENDLATYRAGLHLKIINRSSTELEVSYTIIESFIGEWPDGSEDNSRPTIVRRGQPPNIFNPPSRFNPPASIKWELLNREFFVMARAIPDLRQNPTFQAYSSRHAYSTGGGGTGIWKPGETISFNYDYYLRMKQSATLGFVINICFNRGRKGEDHWFFPVTEDLSTVSAVESRPPQS